MSFNNGWVVYEDIPEKIEKRNILSIAKITIEKQLEKQQKKVDVVSLSTSKMTMTDSSHKRRAAARLRLSNECSCRDTLQRRLDIIDEWMEVVSNERNI